MNKSDVVTVNHSNKTTTEETSYANDTRLNATEKLRRRTGVGSYDNRTVTYLVRSDMLNLELLETGNDIKEWLIFIDELLHSNPSGNNMEAMLTDIYPRVKSALQWCDMPHTRMGQLLSVRSNETSHRNVSAWLPCGSLIQQHYLDPDSSFKYWESVTIQVNPVFGINITIIELHIDSINSTWYRSIFNPQVNWSSEGKYGCHVCIYAVDSICMP